MSGLDLADVQPTRPDHRPEINWVGAPVTVYTLSGCIHCERARALLGRRGIAFEEIRGDGELSFRSRLRSITGRASVPQITIDGTPVGGASDLASLDRRGLLLPLVRRERFPRAIVVRRLNPAALLTAIFRRTSGLWRHRVDIVERDGRRVDVLDAASAAEANQLADAFNHEEEVA